MHPVRTMVISDEKNQVAHMPLNEVLIIACLCVHLVFTECSMRQMLKWVEWFYFNLFLNIEKKYIVKNMVFLRSLMYLFFWKNNTTHFLFWSIFIKCRLFLP